MSMSGCDIGPLMVTPEQGARQGDMNVPQIAGFSDHDPRGGSCNRSRRFPVATDVRSAGGRDGYTPDLVLTKRVAGGGKSVHHRIARRSYGQHRAAFANFTFASPLMFDRSRSGGRASYRNRVDGPSGDVQCRRHGGPVVVSGGKQARRPIQ